MFDAANVATKYIVKPGEHVLVPVTYRAAIARVTCSVAECASKKLGEGMIPCVEDHPGYVVGGMAPSMTREGSLAVPHPCNFATKAERRRQEELNANE